MVFDAETCTTSSGFKAFIYFYKGSRQPKNNNIFLFLSKKEVIYTQTQRGCDWQPSHLKIGTDAKSLSIVLYFLMCEMFGVRDRGLGVSPLSHLLAHIHTMRHNSKMQSGRSSEFVKKFWAAGWAQQGASPAFSQSGLRRHRVKQEHNASWVLSSKC